MRIAFSRTSVEAILTIVGFATLTAGTAIADDKDECEDIRPISGRPQSLEYLSRSYPCFQRAVPVNSTPKKADTVRRATGVASEAVTQSATAEVKNSAMY